MRKREIDMRKLKELLRYKGLGMSQKKTSRALKLSWKTVKKYWTRAEAKGVVYSESLTEEELERRLIVEYGETVPPHRLDQCEWQRIADEVCRSRVGLNVLWEEETAAGRFHLGYSQFCRRFERHHRRHALSFHKEYEPGKIGEVDFCDGLDIVDLKTGAVTSTQLFLMTLGASRYTYAEFCLSQDLPTWIDLHIHAFEYFGGAPEAVVPDNLKSGVSKACRYEPDINPVYTELACHYGFVTITAPFVGLDVAEHHHRISSGQKTLIVGGLMGAMTCLNRMTPGHLALLYAPFEIGRITTQAGLKAVGVRESSVWYKVGGTVGAFAAAEGFVTFVGKGAGASTLSGSHILGRQVLHDSLLNISRNVRESLGVARTAIAHGWRMMIQLIPTAAETRLIGAALLSGITTVGGALITPLLLPLNAFSPRRGPSV